MAKLQFLRKGHIIRTLADDGQHEDKHYITNQKPSISAAKRASRALQEENGGAGRGSLQVVTDLPAIVQA